MRLLFVIILIFSHGAFGQLTTSTAQGPAALVQNVLLGNGVTVSNINYTGAPSAIGSFTANGTNLGLTNGIIMTTGTVVNNGSGPHGPNNQSNAGVDNQRPGYPLLGQQIQGNPSTYNAAILEFDFIPYSDTVRFRYVFASEEYPEYVNTAFNDVFAFFISGPGISGQKNMALIPGTNTPVAINNVNNGNPTNGSGATNPAYYVDNSNPNSFIQYDGFTKVLEAVSKVQCGKTYHLIIAITDVGDGIFDSGIFLEANSLSSKTPVEASYVLSNQSFADPSTMAEGCTDATVTLTRSGNVSNSLTVPINVSGSATMGTDYTNIPNSVTFAPGQTEVQFTFSATSDGIPEGLETVLMDIVLTDPCGNEKPIQLKINIEDIQPLQVEMETQDIVCPGDIATLEANATGGGGTYTYLWSTGETTESIQVNPASTTNYSVTVSESCLNSSATANGTVNVTIFAPFELSASPDITEICPFIPNELYANATGGSGIYTYQWMTDDGTFLGTDSLQEVSPGSSTTYTVIVTDFCGDTVSEEIQYDITSPPLEVTMSPRVEICPGDSILISATAIGGYGDYFYFWPHSNETTQSVWVNPTGTTTYTVFVSDECQTFNVKGTVTISVIQPTANFAISSETRFEDLPISFQNLSQNASSYIWEFGDGNSSTLVHPSNIYDNPGSYVITLIAINDLGCRDTISKLILIEEEWYVYVPNTFTPNDDRMNKVFKGNFIGLKELQIQIFNRWGEMVFTSEDINFEWDGTTPNGEIAPDGTYTYKLSYITRSGVEDKMVGHVNILK